MLELDEFKLFSLQVLYSFYTPSISKFLLYSNFIPSCSVLKIEIKLGIAKWLCEEGRHCLVQVGDYGKYFYNLISLDIITVSVSE